MLPLPSTFLIFTSFARPSLKSQLLRAGLVVFSLD